MLKKRIIASIIIKNNIAVQSLNFKNYLPIGSPTIAVEYLNRWGIDEIIILDISASINNQKPNFQLVKEASKKCFVPITAGGGINQLDQISELMNCGADKISLNQSVFTKKNLITNAAKKFGNQCIVVSIDAVKENNSYKVYNYLTKKTMNISPALFATQLVDLGAGEILINSVDRDGSYKGYDIELINSVCNSVDVPVICSGGAKNALDFIEIFNKSNVSGASAANMFHFNEHSVNLTKKIIKDHINIRTESQINYLNFSFDEMCRLQKQEDETLEKLLFTKIDKEII
ncbi:MAG: hypothetical protein RLZZ546_2969 [Bacteroidota bacterium]|jgi:cyclase